MKHFFLYFLLASFSLTSYCQTVPDSLIQKYASAKTPGDRRRAIRGYYDSFPGADSSKLKAVLDLLSHFTRKEDENAMANTDLVIAYIFFDKGDLSLLLKYALASLPTFEKTKDSAALSEAYSAIGYSLSSQKLPESELYWRKALATSSRGDSTGFNVTLNNVANYFKDWHKDDSALTYVQHAISLASRANDSESLSAAYGTLGEIYTDLRQYGAAQSFIMQSINLETQLNEVHGLVYSLNDLAQVFFETGRFDSSLYFAKKSFSRAYPQYLLESMNACNYIYKCFDQQDKIDSSNKYFRLSASIKDSISSDEKNRSIQNLALQEQIRVHELELANEDAVAQHRQNLENALIALGIVCFMTFILMVSRKLITSPAWIKFLSVIALLLIFEFINLLAHPFFERLTHHSQIGMLLLLAATAALLVPLHHKLERWMLGKIVEKNKERRLAAAKRTIEKLEQGKNELKS